MEGLNFGLSYITGREGEKTAKSTSYQVQLRDIDSDGIPESVEPEEKITPASAPKNRSVFDIDFTYTNVPNLTIGAEYNSGMQEGSSKLSTAKNGDDATWDGLLLMVHYDFLDWAGLTVRYDTFNDKEGAHLENKVNETRNSFTISPTFTLGDGLAGLLEFRSISSNEKTFKDKEGDAKDSETSIALEFTYTF